ncbi:ComEC/Rec2 family competence protein [Streptomyces glaucescens]|uniref:ComEC/Rec2 family competence protein n=1 Tax=Streptomyces glaucescens TaxID=1907 RepID=UPI000AFDCF55|nr:ComEC/Rec2 family competence protein [Streptomyces glaucescens]
MHAASGRRLGDPHPRQEGPADLRLVVPALAAWLTAALLLGAPPGWAAGVAAGGSAGAVALLWAARRTGRPDRGRAEDGAGPGAPGARPRVRVAWLRVPVAAVLVCVAAAAASAGLHGADLRRGPVPELAREYATVTAEVEVTGDPRPFRPRVAGDHAARVSVLLRAEVRAVLERPAHGTAPPPAAAPDRTSPGRTAPAPGAGTAPNRASQDLRAPAPGAGTAPDRSSQDSTAPGSVAGTAPDRSSQDSTAPDPAAGTAPDRPVRDHTAPGRTAQAVTVRTVTRTPVLVIVDAGGGSTRADGAGRPSWLGLLPSTRLRLTGRLAPAVVGGDRIAAVLRVRARAGPEVVRRPTGAQRFAGRLRAGLREATDGLPADARALLPGLVVGDTSRIGPDLDAAFKETDLAHTLAVSGSNLTIVLALLLGPPGLAQRAERRGLAPRLGVSLRGTALLGGVLTLGFVVVCRPDPSVLRAAACGAVTLLALATGRRRSLIPALATAVLLLVLYDPWLSRSYGFLLSVLATGALLTLAPRWSAALRRRGMPSRPAEALAAAAAAQAVCAPVVVVLSARVSLVAVPCNLLAECALAPATVLGFAALAAAPVAMPVAEALAWCAGWPAGWIAGIARTGAALPGAGVDWPGGWAGAGLLLVVTGAVLVAGRRLLRHPWLCVAGGLLLVLAVVQPPPLTRVITGWPPPGWRLALCDVGQGDATVLAAGEGTGVVVDAGPDPVLVDRCLRGLGITRIPLVVLTHFHADHVAGLPGVLRGRTVGAVQTTGYQEPAEQAEFVRREAAARRVPVTRAAAGERRRSGGLSWEVLWPPASGPVPEGPNDASVALLVRSAGLRMLLLGDLEPPAQRALLRTPAAALIDRVDVLKVAHHGSAYQDPELLRRAAPRLALISAGEDNPYGHPAPSTLAALRAQGAAVLRTDRGGAIAVIGVDRHGRRETRVARD